METKVYAELTGIFDDYAVIQDNNFFRLITTALASLAKAFGADHCIDLEPNSLLSAVFSLLTMSTHRLGLVKPEDQFRSSAYTQSLSFNIYAPIHLYYDNMAKMLTGNDAILSEARDQFSLRISQLGKSADMPTFCLAPFTSDFAPERRMPAFVWAHFLRQRFPKQQIRLVLLGSQKDKSEAQNFISELKMQLPYMIVEEKCGQYTLQKTASTLMASHEVWAIDSGLLHIARLLGVPCTSFWGPTNPNQRLRTIDGLKETVHYKAFACSPCTHIIGDIPCGGNNLCMTIMAEPNPNRAPLWLVE